MTDTPMPPSGGVPADQTSVPQAGADRTGAAAPGGGQQQATEGQQQGTGGQTGAGLSDEQARTVRSAAILAGALVSRAEKGFFDTFKESFAASKAVKDAKPEIQRLLATGGLPEMPRATSPEELENATLDMVRQAVAALKQGAPELLEDYKATVLQSCRDVAAAADDTSGNEQQAISKVEQALNG